MPRQFEINLAFTADTEKAKNDIRDLQKTLNQLMSNTSMKTSEGTLTQFTTETKQAMKDVAQLQAMLNNSVNQSTGRLDLGKFNTSLKESGMTLQTLQKSFLSLGEQGEKAFLQVAQSVMSADVSLRTTNKVLNDLWITLKNTAKWELSSSLVKGFTGAIQSAFSYAEDLNRSLTQIQIVTGNSTQQMANFAKQANIAAKELSTTTTEYSDAALIYYQQGLGETETKARTDITVAAANAAGISAEEMSDYLTAVWNSYKVGSDELEHYADVMAAVGAGTATSLEEISSAMEKVASVGESTGVNFEQLSAIIATVSSVTRQSAESIGTGYKTILARMADLELEGSVEEDGVTTTLGSVSSQLKAVGVDILDTNGDLRDMGVVLEELMGKWNGMDRATQQAIAIAIAGKRQYTQLLALMNNQDMYWDAVQMGVESDGETQRQAEVYAESWEAAQKRVKAAAEGVYDSLINDDFFIDFNNGLADVLGGIEKFIDTIGGMSGLLLQLGTIVSNVFSKQIASSISNAGKLIMNFLPAGRKRLEAETKALRNSASQLISETVINSVSTTGVTGEAQSFAVGQRNQVYAKFIENAERYTAIQKNTIQYLLDQYDILSKEVIKQAELTQEAQETAQAQSGVLKNVSPQYSSSAPREGRKSNLEDRYNQRSSEAAFNRELQNSLQGFTRAKASVKDLTSFLDALDTQLQQNGQSMQSAFGESTARAVEKLRDKIKQLNGQGTVEDLTADMQALDNIINKNIIDADKLKNQTVLSPNTAAQVAAQDTSNNTDEQKIAAATQKINEYVVATDKKSAAEAKNVFTQANMRQGTENLKNTMDSLTPRIMSMSESLMTFGNIVMTAASIMSSFTSIIRTVTDDDLDFWEKLERVLMTFPQILLSAGTLINVFNTGLKAKTALHGADAAAAGADALATKGLQAALSGLLTTPGTLLGITLALTALTAGIMAIINIYKAQSEQIQETAKESKELLNTQNELKENTDSLTASIETLTTNLAEQRNAGEDLTSTYNDLKTKLEEVRNNYKEMGVEDSTLSLLQQAEAVGLVTDNWEEYNEVKKQAEKEAREENKRTTEQDVENQYKAALDVFQQGQGTKANYNYDTKEEDNVDRYVRHVGDMGTNDDIAAIFASGNYDEILKDISGSDAMLVFDAQNAKELVYQYTLLGDLLKEIEQTKTGTDSDTYTELKEEYDSMAETMDQIQTDFDQLEQYKFEDKLDELNIDPANIESFAEYRAVLEKVASEMKDYYGSTGKAYEKTKEFLGSFSNTTEFSSMNSFLENFGRKLQEAIDLTKKWNGSGKFDLVSNATYNRDELKAEFQQMVDYFASLSESDQQLAMSVKLDYIDSFEDFQTAFDNLKEFKKKVILEIDPATNLEGSSEIRDNLSSYLETYAEQGYLTISQTADLLQEFPEYEKYIIQLGEGYGLTQAAIDDYNAALENQKEAIDALIEPAQLGREAIYNFAEELTSMETIAEGDYLKGFLENIQELNIQFLNGATDIDTYIDTFTDAFDNLDFSKFENIEDTINFINTVAPRALSTLTEYLSEAEEEFENGSISSDDYRKSVQKSADGLIDITEAQLKALDSQRNSSKWTDDQEKQYKQLEERLGELRNAYDDFNDFEPFADIFDDYSSVLSQLFDENWQLKVDGSELDNLLNQLNSMYPQLQAAWNKMNAQQQANIQGMISSYTSTMAISEDLINQFGVDAETIQGWIGTTAMEMVNGTYNSANQSAQISALATAAIADSGVQANLDLYEASNDVISALETILNNFDGYIDFTFSFSDSATSTFDIPFIGPIELPGIRLSVAGASVGDYLQSDAGASALNNLTSKWGNYKSLSGFGGGLPFTDANYYGNGRNNSPGNISSIDFDNPPDTSGSSKSDDKGSEEPKTRTPQHTEKQDTASDLELPEEVVERYENTDNLLESIERRLTKIGNEREGLWGDGFIAKLDEENEALRDQIDLLGWQMDEAKKYAEEDLGTLRSAGIDVQLDENGVITNAEQIRAAIQQMRIDEAKAYDAQVNTTNADYDAQVNALAADDSEGENALKTQNEATLQGFEDAHDAKTKYFDSLEEALDNYGEDWNKYWDNAEKREEILQQIRENNLEKITHKLEIQMEMTEFERNNMEFLRSTFREGLFGIQDNINFDNAEISNYSLDLQNINSAIDELNTQFANGEISEEQYATTLKDLTDQARDASQSIVDLSKQIGEYWVEALEDSNSILEENLDNFEHLLSLMDSFESLTKLITSEDNYSGLSGIYDDIVEISRDALTASQANYEFLAEQEAQAEKMYQDGIAKGLSQTTLDQLKENWETARQLAQEGQEQMLSDAQAFGEAAQQQYENTVNQIMKEYEDAVTSGKGFDWMNAQMEHLQLKDTEYLTETNKLYQTQKLIRQANLDLENTENKAAQNRLQSFIKETEELENQTNVSAYALGIQERKYQVLLAEIALQEAQNAKDQVRLQRDTEGNFNYVYTADEDSIAQAEQELADAQNDLYNYVREKENEIRQAELEAQQEHAQNIADIWITYANDKAARDTALLEENKRFQDEMAMYKELSNLSMEASDQAYTDSYAADLNDRYLASEESTAYQIDANERLEDANTSLQENNKVVSGIITKNYGDVQSKSNEFATEASNDLREVEGIMSTVTASTQQWANTMGSLIGSVTNHFQALAASCRTAMEVISGFQSTVDYSLLGYNAGSYAEALQHWTTRDTAIEYNIDNKGQFTENDLGGLDLVQGIDTDLSALILSSGTKEEALRWASLREAKKSDQVSGNYYDSVQSTKAFLAQRFGKNSPEYQWIIDKLREENVPGFDTGGYTGEFEGGKFALLHEKELVLNKQDTQNLLDTIDIVDKLLSTLNYQNLLAGFGIGGLENNIRQDSNKLEQEVTIHAEFPNVQTHDEIEQAIYNLTNTAAQYANRKRL